MAIYYKLLFMKYQTLINKNIKELRLNNNLTQEEFAEKIDISVQGLSNIERNRYQPTASTIDKICNVFDITPVELLLAKPDTSQDIIKNITLLLSNCSDKRLKKIYEIILMMLKL